MKRMLVKRNAHNLDVAESFKEALLRIGFERRSRYIEAFIAIIDLRNSSSVDEQLVSIDEIMARLTSEAGQNQKELSEMIMIAQTLNLSFTGINEAALPIFHGILAEIQSSTSRASQKPLPASPKMVPNKTQFWPKPLVTAFHGQENLLASI